MPEVPTYPIVYQRGDSLSGLSWQWRGVDGEPRDLTDYTAELHVHDVDGDLVLTLTNGAGLVIDSAEGRVSVDASPPLLAALDADTTYAYTITVTSGDASIRKTLTKGPLRVDGLPMNS